jgi:hypothetical protein
MLGKVSEGLTGPLPTSLLGEEIGLTGIRQE